jgi:hypothetical protein
MRWTGSDSLYGGGFQRVRAHGVTTETRSWDSMVRGSTGGRWNTKHPGDDTRRAAPERRRKR